MFHLEKLVRSLPAGLILMLLTAGARANTIVVTSGDDSGPGTLRQAIADAHFGDTIMFGSIDLIRVVSPLFIVVHGKLIRVETQLPQLT